MNLLELYILAPARARHTNTQSILKEYHLTDTCMHTQSTKVVKTLLALKVFFTIRIGTPDYYYC